MELLDSRVRLASETVASRYFVFFLLESLDPVLIVVPGVMGWTLCWLPGVFPTTRL
jgi:hypothetical protein